ncbi:MAG: endonuclease domain-containing protein [Dehalococcoidia bacterium]
MGRDETTRPRWKISPELRQRMTLVARELRARSTRGEDLLWEGLRNRRLLGRKFRRQQPVGPFVLDFYCGEERLAVEVDGPVHEQQRAADAERQALLETLGIRFVRVRDDLVQTDLPSALRTISAAFGADGEIAAPDR